MRQQAELRQAVRATIQTVETKPAHEGRFRGVVETKLAGAPSLGILAQTALQHIIREIRLEALAQSHPHDRSDEIDGYDKQALHDREVASVRSLHSGQIQQGCGRGRWSDD